MPNFRVHIQYNDVVQAGDQFEAEQIVLAYVERHIHAEEVEPNEGSAEEQEVGP
jgi:hypothetical protein